MGRPQASAWKQEDWLRLARLVLKSHRLKTKLYFDPGNPDAQDIVKEADLPLTARQVPTTPPKIDDHWLRRIPLAALLDEAQEFVESARQELAGAERALTAIGAGTPNPVEGGP